MNIAQQNEVIKQAEADWSARHDNILIDARVGDPEGFDEEEEGVWVRAWVWVPKEAIPGYQMAPPAPASVVTSTILMTYNEFAAKYRAAYKEDGENVTNEQISNSWAAYVRNPEGHFLTKHYN